MKIRFACPSCGASGSVDAVYAGKVVRCKHCGFRSAVPDAGEPQADIYSLDESPAETAGNVALAPAADSVFAASPRGSVKNAPKPRKTVRVARSSTTRKRRGDFAWRNWLIGFAEVARWSGLGA